MNAASLPLLEARGLEFEYPGGFRLGPLDLRLHPGELAVLSGEPGAGKSTLLRVLGARLPLQAGTLLLGQEPLAWTGKGRCAWRRRLGLLDQSAQLPPHRTPRELVRLCLAARGMSGRARRLEAMRVLGETGQLTRADLPCGKLSTGQGRWAQLALALCGLPELLLLDEPFAHLSPEHQDELLVFLQLQAARGTAVLFCHHGERPLLPDHVRRLRLRDGRIETPGTGAWR